MFVCVRACVRARANVNLYACMCVYPYVRACMCERYYLLVHVFYACVCKCTCV